MRIQIMSDLHAEFMRDNGLSFMKTLPDTGADVLVLAGDVGMVAGGSLFRMLECALARFRDVVYVTGNHEYYRSSPAEVHEAIAAFGRRHAGFHWLSAGTVEIAGQRFIGATLWFPPCRDQYARGLLSDFSVIADFEPWVYEQHAQAVEYLEAHVQPGDIVVTHHLPSSSVVHPRWVGNALNPFFASDSLSTAVLGRAAVWVYGHTHDSKDDRIGATRLLVNPFGYARHELNPNFDEALCIDC